VRSAPLLAAAGCTWPHRVALRAAHTRLSALAGAVMNFADVPHSLLRPNDALDSLPGVDEFAVRTYHQLQRTCSSLLHAESFRANLGQPHAHCPHNTHGTPTRSARERSTTGPGAREEHPAGLGHPRRTG
jgi:hypothetical protein